MLFGVFAIVSDFSKFHEEVNYLKDVLKKKIFPTNLVDKCVKIFLTKQFSYKVLKDTVPKKELFIMLTYLGMSSFFFFSRRLQKASIATFHFVKLKLTRLD